MIGETIRQYRINKHISQAELGRLVSIDQTLISRIERGERKVYSEELLEFSKALDVDVEDLLDKKEVKQ